MDYTKVPRELIYKDRNDLKEFGVQIQESMNYLLFMRLKQQALMGASGAREIALRCYNNAYYVCTLILLEANDFPELRISDYVNKILEIEKDNKNIDEFVWLRWQWHAYYLPDTIQIIMVRTERYGKP